MYIKKIFVIAILFVVNVTAQNTFEFMRIDVSPRSSSLGGSFVSNYDDPNVIFYNPAGLRMLDGHKVSASYVGYISDVSLAGVSYSGDFLEDYRFGAGIKYVNYGNFVEADEFGNKSGNFSANELAFILGGAGYIDSNFAYGLNVKFIYSGIADRSASAIAADLGLQYFFPSEEINIGVSLLNLGTQLSSYYDLKEELPIDFMIGISKKLAHIPLRLSLDFHRLNKNESGFGNKFKNFTAGAEFTLSKALKLRIGYDNQKRKDLKIGSFSGLSGFNGGVGLTIKNYVFDYSYSSMGLLDAIHRIGISTGF